MPARILTQIREKRTGFFFWDRFKLWGISERWTSIEFKYNMRLVRYETDKFDETIFFSIVFFLGQIVRRYRMNSEKNTFYQISANNLQLHDSVFFPRAMYENTNQNEDAKCWARFQLLDWQTNSIT